jgi:hypothetical protein
MSALKGRFYRRSNYIHAYICRIQSLRMASSRILREIRLGECRNAQRIRMGNAGLTHCRLPDLGSRYRSHTLHAGNLDAQILPNRDWGSLLCRDSGGSQNGEIRACFVSVY